MGRRKSPEEKKGKKSFRRGRAGAMDSASSLGGRERLKTAHVQTGVEGGRWLGQRRRARRERRRERGRMERHGQPGEEDGESEREAKRERTEEKPSVS